MIGCIDAIIGHVTQSFGSVPVYPRLPGTGPTHREELTCAGVVVDADVAGEADAQEGAGCVDAHCVLPTVVLALRTLVHICRKTARWHVSVLRPQTLLGSSDGAQPKSFVQREFVRKALIGQSRPSAQPV